MAWDEYIGFFRALGYRTYAPALPQHFTQNSPEDVAGLRLKDYVDQLERDYLACGEKPIIVGHSMGGLLAQQLAERVAPPALVLLAPAPSYGLISFDVSPLRTMFKQLLTPLFWTKGLKPGEQAVRYGIYNKVPEAEQQKLIDRLCYESGQVIREIACWFTDPSQGSRVRPENINCPVLTLVGKHDRITPAEVCRKVSQSFAHNSHFHVLSKHGHMLNCEPGWEAIAQQVHVWLCWQLGHQGNAQKAA